MIELEFKESQRIALEILKKVACICEEHNFRYVLIWGTLIGAIRHNGFIPWDDDIDIAMPRPDYDKLLSFFKKHRDELMPLECLTMETRKNYPHMIARISDSRTWIDVVNEKDCGMGVFVDIYPFDGLGKTYDEAFKTMEYVGPNNSLIFLAARKYYHKGNTKGIIKKSDKVSGFYLYSYSWSKIFCQENKQIT